MLTQEDSDPITRVGPGTPMGNLMRDCSSAATVIIGGLSGDVWRCIFADWQ
jgi:hypothetical protein